MQDAAQLNVAGACLLVVAVYKFTALVALSEFRFDFVCGDGDMYCVRGLQEHVGRLFRFHFLTGCRGGTVLVDERLVYVLQSCEPTLV